MLWRNQTTWSRFKLPNAYNCITLLLVSFLCNWKAAEWKERCRCQSVLPCAALLLSRENMLSCKTHSFVSSEEGFYCTKILTYFVINGLVLAEKMVPVTFTVSLDIFILLPALQFSVRSKQNEASLKSSLFIYRWSLTLSMAWIASKLSKLTD